MTQLQNLSHMKPWNENFQEQYQLFNVLLDKIDDISYKFRFYGKDFGYDSNNNVKIEKDTTFRTTPNFVYEDYNSQIHHLNS